jgi:hypothetical protein
MGETRANVVVAQEPLTIVTFANVPLPYVDVYGWTPVPHRGEMMPIRMYIDQFVTTGSDRTTYDHITIKDLC